MLFGSHDMTTQGRTKHYHDSLCPTGEQESLVVGTIQDQSHDDIMQPSQTIIAITGECHKHGADISWFFCLATS